MLPTIEWQPDAVVMVDQRKLPGQEIYVRCKTPKEVAKAIVTMVIRGAPAIGVAAAMGIDLLTEEQYRELQKLGEFDTKTSSWVRTPSDVRALGGALFCDRRYGKVFVYHNGAQSYYAARGFRGTLRV